MDYWRINRQAWVTAVLSILPLLSACGERTIAPPATPAFCVVAEFYPLYVDVLNVVGETPGVQVTNLVSTATGCPEDYQLSPGDVKSLDAAKVFIINGAGLEGFLDKVAEQCPHLQVVDASATVEKLETGGAINPHVWVSPLLAVNQVRAIAAALAKYDPTHAASYQKNAGVYEARLAAMAEQCRAELAAAPVRRIVVFHDSMPYLARDLNLQIVAVMEPAPGQNPSPRELADVAARIHAASGPVALLTELDSRNPAADILSRELGLPLFSLDTCTGGPLEPAAAREAYLRAMAKNLAMLRVALGMDKNSGKVSSGL